MARQVINTSPPTGDPAPTAFNKANANFEEIYGWGAGGALAKLVGGNTFEGNQNVNGQVNASGGSDITGRLRILGTTNSFVLTDRSDAARSWHQWANVANLYWVFNGNTVGLSLTSGGNLAASGSVSGTQFVPSSSADVKDFIEGYTGDACGQLDRIAVCRYRYRPEFHEGDKTYVGIVAENFADILPDAVTEETHSEEIDVVVGQDESGNPIIRKQTRIVPMGYDMGQLLALNTRSHQQKNRRIKQLEVALEGVLQRLAALESAA